ncbi:MAG: hypothetical protein ACK47B_12365 [Armatimonadota bacterium]
MLPVKVVLVDDNPSPNVAPIRLAVEGASARLGEHWDIDLQRYLVPRGDTDWEAHARRVLAQVPDIVLSDGMLNGSLEDGPTLLRYLCCTYNYAGFAYLWTGANESTVGGIASKHKVLFGHVGAGCFRNSDSDALSIKIEHDYLHCGHTFRIRDASVRCFDPLDSALHLLTEVLPLCFEPDSPDRTAILTRFRSSVTAFRSGISALTQTGEEPVQSMLSNVSAAASAVLTSSEADMVAHVEELRDVLFAVCARVGYQ